MRILVVEDDATLAELHALTLGVDHDITIVTDGYERLLAPAAWDGIEGAVVDLWLGDTVSGADILGWLAEHRPDIRRVLYSASTTALNLADLADAIVLKGAGSAADIRAALTARPADTDG